MNGDLGLVAGILLLAFGTAGVLVTLLLLVWVFGPWTMAVAAGFAVVAAISAILIGAEK